MIRLRFLPVLGFAILLSSCGEKKELKEELKAIKYITVNTRAKVQVRKFSGVVSAVNYSSLSFQDISGRVIKVNVDIGDKVKKGDILAEIDKERFELDVKDAEAGLSKASANLVKADADYSREVQLMKKQASFQKRVDQYKYQQAAAVSAVKSATAKLGLAKRNLRNTALRAPYNGFIGMRQIEPNQEVKVGQKIFQIDAEGESEVHFDIPESLIKRASLGMIGTVTFPSHPAGKAEAKITFLGTAAGKGNAFPAKALLLNNPSGIRPGMTAEISLPLPVNSTSSGFLIPPEALLPGSDPSTAYVFVYNPKTSKLKKIKITGAGTWGNLSIIQDGIKEGDIIAVAGVSFLADGMKVKLYKSEESQNDKSGE